MFKLMFVGSRMVHRTNDIDTAADVIMGMTGNDKDYERTSAIMGNMTFGDEFHAKTFTIQCVPEEE